MHREFVPDGKLTLRTPEHQHFLFEGLEFPAGKQELVDYATDVVTDPDTLNLVRSLPDRQYLGPDDIWRSIAEATRVMAGGPNVGTPRDDIGKQGLKTANGLRHP